MQTHSLIEEEEKAEVEMGAVGCFDIIVHRNLDDVVGHYNSFFHYYLASGQTCFGWKEFLPLSLYF